MAKKYGEEQIIEKVGGRFKLASLLEKRYKELLFGTKPLVEIDSTDPLDILIAEVMEGKIELIPEAAAVAAAQAALVYEPASDSEREAERIAEQKARAAVRGREEPMKEKEKEEEDEDEE
jgi:DNA-directed RNA polymerase subunit omega